MYILDEYLNNAKIKRRVQEMLVTPNNRLHQHNIAELSECQMRTNRSNCVKSYESRMSNSSTRLGDIIHGSAKSDHSNCP